MNLDHNRLRYRCRRGMKELDLLLQRYLEQQFAGASEQEQRIFAELLEQQDPELYGYLVGRDVPADPAVADVIRKISAVHKP